MPEFRDRGRREKVERKTVCSRGKGGERVWVEGRGRERVRERDRVWGKGE